MNSTLTITDRVRAGTMQVLTVGLMGPQGPPGFGTITRIAAATLGGHRVVRLNANGQAVYADCTDLTDASAVLGLTTGAVTQGDNAIIQIGGELIEPSWNWDMDLPVFLNTVGQLTQVPPAGAFALCVGVPLSATRLLIRIGEPILL